MTKKIFRAILCASAAVLLASLALVMGYLYEYFGSVQEKQLKDALLLAASAVQAAGPGVLEHLSGPGGPGPEAAHYRLTWVAADGTVLFDSTEPAEDLENHADRIEIREAFANGESSSVRYSATLTERTLYCAAMLHDGTVLRISVRQITAWVLLLAMLQPLLLTVLFAVILSAVLAGRMSKNIVRPLNALDLDHPLENSAYEELKPLLRRIHRQNRQICAAERSRREFTANVSHELKTPLQSILGSAELLKNGVVQQEDIPRFSGLIHTEASRLVALVEDIIHLSRLDEGAAPPKESVDLLQTAEKAVDALRDSADKRHIQISVTGERVCVDGVPVFLYEMLYNLCDNAIKYNVDGGRVDVSVSAKEHGPAVTVRDTGIGIPPEYQSRVFERFFRVDKSRSKASGGTGLGLSIVKHIAQYHHAAISLHSQEGTGTEITVEFSGCGE